VLHKCAAYGAEAHPFILSETSSRGTAGLRLPWRFTSSDDLDTGEGPSEGCPGLLSGCLVATPHKCCCCCRAGPPNSCPSNPILETQRKPCFSSGPALTVLTS
jgi:hypothetical protein